MTPYPAKATVIFGATVMLAGIPGPLVASVWASMVNFVADENLPSAEISTITVRGSPGPLLSLGLCTARSAAITTTDPSLFRVARISTVEVSVALS